MIYPELQAQNILLADDDLDDCLLFKEVLEELSLSTVLGDHENRTVGFPVFQIFGEWVIIWRHGALSGEMRYQNKQCEFCPDDVAIESPSG